MTDASDASAASAAPCSDTTLAALLLSNADPLGLMQSVTRRVRQRGTVALIDALSLVGGPANANAGHLGGGFTFQVRH